MKRFATEEDKAVAPIPDIVGIAVVVVQPQIAVVAAHIEQARIARRVVMHKMPSISPPSVKALFYLCRSPKLNFIPHHNAPALCTKYLHFL